MLAQVEPQRPSGSTTASGPQIVQHLLDLETVQAAEKAGVKASKGYEQKATIALQQVSGRPDAGRLPEEGQGQRCRGQRPNTTSSPLAPPAGQQLPAFEQIKPQILQHLAQQKVGQFQENLLRKARAVSHPLPRKDSPQFAGCFCCRPAPGPGLPAGSVHHAPELEGSRRRDRSTSTGISLGAGTCLPGSGARAGSRCLLDRALQRPGAEHRVEADLGQFSSAASLT